MARGALSTFRVSVVPLPLHHLIASQSCLADTELAVNIFDYLSRITTCHITSSRATPYARPLPFLLIEVGTGGRFVRLGGGQSPESLHPLSVIDFAGLPNLRQERQSLSKRGRHRY